jgi:uncharacterized membrane protein YdbT with pleckstrin-like domain
MSQTSQSFRTIMYRPHWSQWVISQGFMFLLCIGMLMAAGWEGMTIRLPFYIGAAFTGLCVLYGSLYLSKLRFIVTDEQLIIEHGVLSRSSDYIELYRVVDFGERRDIMEQLFGLKTVSIYSGDRTTPRLDIYGIRENTDVVGIIRERVNYNKTIRHIYEFTNTK